MGLLTYARERLDSWVNVVTSIGGAASRSAFSFEAERLLTDYELEAMFEGDPYVNRVCRVVPEESFAKGYVVKTGNARVDEWIKGRLEELGASGKLTEGWTWARAYGTGGVVLGANDGRDPSEPLDHRSIKSVPFLITFDRREMRPVRWYGEQGTHETDRDPVFQRKSEALFGEPSLYALNRAGGSYSGTRYIHASRVIRFEGAMTSKVRKRANNGWSQSEIQRIYSALQKFNGAWEASSTLLQDASQGVLSIKNLMSMMAGDRSDEVRKRLMMLDITRSMSRSILVDADKESFSRVESSVLTGLPGVLDKFMLLFAGVAEVPVTILFGQAPAGLNATGDSDIRWFYDRLKNGQTNTVQPRLERIVRALLCSQDSPTRGIEPEGWTVEFNKLWQLTEKEDAEVRKIVADMDAVYLSNQVVTPEEIALSRFRDSGWNATTNISLEARREAQQADLEASEGTDPAATPELPAPGATGPESAEGQNVQQSALNGAQVASMLEIVTQVATRAIPRETGVAMLTTAFPVSPADAERIMGEVGRSFFAAVETPKGPASPAPDASPSAPSEAPGV